MSTQERVAMPMEMTPMLRKVVQKARSIIKDILGEYDPDEHFDSCKFSTRATLGNPLRDSYLDAKLGGTKATDFTASLSGSLHHKEWFVSTFLAAEPVLRGIYREKYGEFYPDPVVSSDDAPALNTTHVPKAWDKLRTITPNTTIGSFISYGLGKLIERRLKERARLNIKRLQFKHREYAKEASVTLKSVTADMSAASDSFGADLVNMLLPRAWYRAVSFGRVPRVKIGQSFCSLSSFMAMGIGFTFPLQTLLFYALLKAIQELTGIYGLISVYGDDLIYPTRMHKYVSSILPRLRLVLNQDKTFVDHDFRESCGGDYYRGVDVRPCSPEGTGVELAKLPYVAECYKLINNLLRRWDRAELATTLSFLEREVLRTGNSLFVVPSDAPDFSGIRQDRPFDCPPNSSVPLWDAQKQGWVFKALRYCPRDRLITDERFYYWDWHREARFVDRFGETSWSPFSESTETFRLIKSIPKRYVKVYRNGRRKTFRVLDPVCDDRQRGHYRVADCCGFTTETEKNCEA
jgi:hypothetical protein